MLTFCFFYLYVQVVIFLVSGEGGGGSAIKASTFRPHHYNFSVADDLQALIQLSKDIIRLNQTANNTFNPLPQKVCTPRSFGTTLYGSHMLCPHFEDEHFPCHFLSFGIENDFSFDTVLHDYKQCNGIGLDPTVDHPMKLTPGEIFMKAGANSHSVHKGWTTWSVPELSKWYGHPLFALKMDCEGCEYSLAQDILRDEPYFFDNVLQLNIEIHTPVMFATSSQHVYDLGRLFRLIYLSGMSLIHVDGGTCHPNDEAKGCDKAMKDIHFPCLPGCQSYLFSHNVTTWHAWRLAAGSKRPNHPV